MTVYRPHLVIRQEYELNESPYSGIACVHIDRLGFDPYEHTEIDNAIMSRTLGDMMQLYNCEEYDNLPTKV